MRRLLLVAALAVLASPSHAERRPRRGHKAAAPETAPPHAPAPAEDAAPARSAQEEDAEEPAAPAPSRPAPLTGFIARAAGSGSLLVESAPESGSLAALGLASDDLLMDLGGRDTHASADVDAAVRAWRPGDRLWAAVLRGGAPTGLQTAFQPPAPAPVRAPGALTPREEAARQSHLEAASTQAERPLSTLPVPSLTVAAGEKLWIRFPAGLPRLRDGDVVTAETAAPLAADKRLDFLAVPPGSKVWLTAVSSREEGPVRLVRLHAFKIAISPSRVYPLSALVSAAAGSGGWVRVTPGGSLVTAPGEDAKLDLDPQWTLQLRLLTPLVLHETDEGFRAGPGLWLKEVSERGVRALEVTHVSAGRSADHAGLKPGDRVYSVDGEAAARLGFAQALDKLYGTPGSEVSLRVTRLGSAASETVKLRRGVSWRRGYGLRLRREGDAVLVQEATPGSPAAAVGFKPGLKLVSVGGEDAAALDRASLRKLLEGDGGGSVEFVVAEQEHERTLQLARDWYPSPLKPELQLAPYAP